MLKRMSISNWNPCHRQSASYITSYRGQYMRHAVMSETTFLADAFDPSGLIAAERLSNMLHITRSELAATPGLSRDAVSKTPASAVPPPRRGCETWPRSSIASGHGPVQPSRLLPGTDHNPCLPSVIRLPRRSSERDAPMLSGATWIGLRRAVTREVYRPGIPGS